MLANISPGTKVNYILSFEKETGEKERERENKVSHQSLLHVLAKFLT